jgi:hypothetical protein
VVVNARPSVHFAISKDMCEFYGEIACAVIAPGGRIDFDF